MENYPVNFYFNYVNTSIIVTKAKIFSCSEFFVEIDFNCLIGNMQFWSKMSYVFCPYHDFFNKSQRWNVTLNFISATKVYSFNIASNYGCTQMDLYSFI